MNFNKNSNKPAPKPLPIFTNNTLQKLSLTNIDETKQAKEDARKGEGDDQTSHHQSQPKNANSCTHKRHHYILSQTHVAGSFDLR